MTLSLFIFIHLLTQCFIIQCNAQNAFKSPRLTLTSPILRLPDLINKPITSVKRLVDIKANSTLKLRCEGSKPLFWRFPDYFLVKS